MKGSLLSGEAWAPEGAECCRAGAVALAAKEGLALLNGTQAMASVGGLALLRAERVTRLADWPGDDSGSAEGNSGRIR